MHIHPVIHQLLQPRHYHGPNFKTTPKETDRDKTFIPVGRCITAWNSSDSCPT